MIEVAIADKLLSEAAITSLALGGVYQLVVPQHEKRLALRLQLIDEPRDVFQRGRIGVVSARVQIDAFANESAVADPYESVMDVSLALDAALGPEPFEVLGSPSVSVLLARRDDRRAFEPDEFGNYRMMNDFFFRFRLM